MKRKLTLWRACEQFSQWSKFFVPPLVLVGLCLVALILHDTWRARPAREATETLRQTQAMIREAQAVIRETHVALAVIRKSAELQRGYIEATARRSADIAQRTQLAVKHLDEAIVAGKGTLAAANLTITQANESIEQIRQDSVRAIDSIENVGESAAFAGRQVGFLAVNVNEVVKHLNEGSELAIKQLIAGTLEFREGVAELRERVADPRVGKLLDGAAMMPALVADTRTGVQEATKTVQCGRRGLWRVIRGCKD